MVTRTAEYYNWNSFGMRKPGSEQEGDVKIE